MKLDFSQDYTLENDVVRLEPLQQWHVHELFKVSRDPRIWVYFFENGMDITALSNYVNAALSKRKAEKEYPYAIFDKRANQFAGSTRFYEYSYDLKTIKLGHTWLGVNFQGRGVNKNTKHLLFEFAFEQLQLERIGFGAYSDNIRSVNAMKSVGCVQEGLLRNAFPSIDGKGRTDAILMSILKHEWQDKVKNELRHKLL